MTRKHKLQTITWINQHIGGQIQYLEIERFSFFPVQLHKLHVNLNPPN